MSQLPQNNEAFDNNSEYNMLNQTNGSWQPYAGVCIPLLTWVWAPDFTVISLILGILGIWQGRVAKRHGVPALAGRILSWAGVGIVLALYLFVILFLISLSQSL